MTALPRSDELFNDWLRFRGASTLRPLTKAAARPYESIWSAWCEWLAAHPGAVKPNHVRGYHEATPEDLVAFLEFGPRPRSGRRRRESAPLSEITRRRYWRVIDALYRYALTKDASIVNPAAAMTLGDRPAPERPEGQVFNLLQWSAVYAGVASGPDLWAVRDRAILHLVMDAALTNSEVCQLKLGDVRPALNGRTLELDLKGKRKAQERTLELGALASGSLRTWLDCRPHMKSPARPRDEQPVFLTAKGRGVTARVLFPVVVAAVDHGFKALNLELPNHLGPQVLRNSRLAQWLNDGVSLATVIKRAGFKDRNSLRGLLLHLNPEVLAEVIGGETRSVGRRGISERPSSA